MLSGLAPIQVVGLAVLAGVGFVVSTAIKLILEREYTSWAPALARLLTRLAGVLHPGQRGQWWADLQYEQKVKGETGLFQAGSCLASAPALALRHGVAAVKGWRRRRRIPDERRPSEYRELSAQVHASSTFSGTLEVIRMDPQAAPTTEK